MSTAELPKLTARIHPYNDQSGRPTKLLAFADLVIAESFIIKGIRILEKNPGEPFAVFPAEKRSGAGTSEWFDLAHPLTAAARTAALRLILSEYAKIAK